VVAALALVGAAAASTGADGSGACPVTISTQKVAPNAGPTAAGFNYGTAKLRVHLGWPRGVLPAGRLPDGGSYAIVEPDGAIRTKVGWWRGVPGRLKVRGRRLDGNASPLAASASDGYGPTGFQPSILTFPSTGCWRVIGSVGVARLTFVVKVVRI
jgi:hypothetical protein